MADERHRPGATILDLSATTASAKIDTRDAGQMLIERLILTEADCATDTTTPFVESTYRAESGASMTFMGGHRDNPQIPNTLSTRQATPSASPSRTDGLAARTASPCGGCCR